jgi:tRNA (guanine37-N1)-methyltransferase
MLHVGVVTLFPDMFAAIRDYGITGRAIERELIRLEFWNPRDYASDHHRSVDDKPYGGGAGMVLMVAPMRAAITAARRELPKARVYALTPQGRPIDQRRIDELSAAEQLILVAGRYEGIDERILQADVDEELSLGDFVVSGGELPAMALIDAMIRTLPGALGDADSARNDSFAQGLLDYPHFTRPEEIGGQRVPDVLLSGDHSAIARWRHKQALGRTWLRRPDLLEAYQLDAEAEQLLAEFIAEHSGSSEE